MIHNHNGFDIAMCITWWHSRNYIKLVVRCWISLSNIIDTSWTALNQSSFNGSCLSARATPHYFKDTITQTQPLLPNLSRVCQSSPEALTGSSWSFVVTCLQLGCSCNHHAQKFFAKSTRESPLRQGSLVLLREPRIHLLTSAGQCAFANPCLVVAHWCVFSRAVHFSTKARKLSPRSTAVRFWNALVNHFAAPSGGWRICPWCEAGSLDSGWLLDGMDSLLQGDLTLAVTEWLTASASVTGKASWNRRVSDLKLTTDIEAYISSVNACLGVRIAFRILGTILWDLYRRRIIVGSGWFTHNSISGIQLDSLCVTVLVNYQGDNANLTHF